MIRNLLGVSVALVAASAGCAEQPPARPEPQTSQLTIADQSTDAPPPPPPSAPPPGAQASAPPPPAEQSPPNSAPPSPSQPPSAPPPNAVATPAPVPQSPPSVASAPAPTSAPQAPPNAAQWAYEYPTGRWVYGNGYGWMWVPANAEVSDADGVPYAYIYTPSYGWNWYISPWGPGPYRYGVWVTHPYRPFGYRGGWVAHPRVVVRLGGGVHHGYYRHRRGW